MELNEEEIEVIALFLSNNWAKFFDESQDFMSISALHRLAEKFMLSESKPRRD
ncbi:hypothetical protein RM156_12500 [Pantoea agglomerans]|uniref:hypothetical protein n=1 Tax=Enterobacter agglomerans TaxID=549 RepID=UPI00289C1051|nr:hypothetical protein [Pantoea agglomerans]WNK65701.1 hypothetical protein RM156_12500 [Pantoea agglomerans]